MSKHTCQTILEKRGKIAAILAAFTGEYNKNPSDKNNGLVEGLKIALKVMDEERIDNDELTRIKLVSGMK